MCRLSWISLSNATHSRFESCQYIRTSKSSPAISQRFLWYAHSIWIQISCNTGRSWCIWFVVTLALGATRPRPRLLQIKYITPTRVTTITYCIPQFPVFQCIMLHNKVIMLEKKAIMLVMSVSSQAILIITYQCKFTIQHICSMHGRGSQVNACYTGASNPRSGTAWLPRWMDGCPGSNTECTEMSDPARANHHSHLMLRFFPTNYARLCLHVHICLLCLNIMSA